MSAQGQLGLAYEVTFAWNKKCIWQEKHNDIYTLVYIVVRLTSVLLAVVLEPFQPPQRVKISFFTC